MKDFMLEAQLSAEGFFNVYSFNRYLYYIIIDIVLIIDWELSRV